MSERVHPRVSIRLVVAVVLVVVAFAPAAALAAWMTALYREHLTLVERQLQTAVLAELASATDGAMDSALADARAVAAALALAAEAKEVGRAEELVASVLGSRPALDAVRFEVPSAHVSTVLRRSRDGVEVPRATLEQRREAELRGAAVTVAADGSVVLVVPVRAPREGARGYVVARANLDGLRERLARAAASRFEGASELYLVDAGRRAIAVHGVAGLGPGGDTSARPLWGAAPPTTQAVALIADHDAGVPMVAAVQTLPRWRWTVAVARPRAVVYRQVDALTRTLLVAAPLALVVVVALGLLAARTLTRPVLRLVTQTRLIGQRRWDELALEVRRGDELGDLHRAVSDMVGELAASEAEVVRQARLRADLSRFMSQELVAAIVRGEHQMTLGGRRAEVSVLFADVVAFTPLAESRSAEEVVTLLNELFGILSEIVFRHEGIVDKFVGDCVMAVWGAPVAQPDHARRALAAAEDMLRFLAAANDDWRVRYGVELRLGIGVNSGDAIVGNLGSEKRMEYTVVGDTVNVAARLEAIARPNQILVGARTRELVGEAFPLLALGPQRLTGREAPTEVFALET